MLNRVDSKKINSFIHFKPKSKLRIGNDPVTQHEVEYKDFL